MTLPPPPSRLAAACVVALCGLLPAAAQACGMAPYIGSICTFSFRKCPAGFIEADGTVLPVAQHQALAALLGNIFGGDGTSTFALPDLRARMMVGTGTGAGLSPVRPGQALGQQTLVLDSSQAPLRAHTHGATFTPTTAQVPITIPASAGDLALDGGLPISQDASKATTTPAGPVYLTTLVVKTGPTTATLSGPYTAVKPDVPAASKVPVNIKVSGIPGTPAVSAQVDTLTGGAITLADSGSASAQPFPTQSPGLGMVVCIAEQGNYPIQESASQVVIDTQ